MTESITLIRWMLSLTPAQRLRRQSHAHHVIPDEKKIRAQGRRYEPELAKRAVDLRGISRFQAHPNVEIAGGP